MKVTISKAILTSINSLSIGASKDDVTPVITQIALTREGEDLRAMATDRYIVVSGRYSEVTFEGWEDGETILIDPKSLKSVVDLGKSDKHGVIPVTIGKDVETGHSWAQVDGYTKIHLGSVTSKFPPVMNLMKFEADPNGAPTLGLKPDFLAKLGKVLPPVKRPDRERIWEFHFRSKDGNRFPAPVYAVYSDGSSYEMEALVQPSLLQR